jgi:hypothetical protein
VSTTADTGVSPATNSFGYGGGGRDSSTATTMYAGPGAIRIIWPGIIRTFPYITGK